MTAFPLPSGGASYDGWPKVGLTQPIADFSVGRKVLTAIEPLPPEQKVGGSTPLGRTKFLLATFVKSVT